MFDTHCHLNFSAFDKNRESVIEGAHQNGVDYILIPGTDVATSKKAVIIAETNENVYAAVGVHPHHVFETAPPAVGIERLLQSKKVVAVGEVGIDRHEYKKTKYENYKIDESFIETQKDLLEKQILLALTYDKSLILHNREAKEDTLSVLNKAWDKKLEGRTVFHCCEPNSELLEFSKSHKIFIGVDGDVTYSAEKQEFIKSVPIEMLVLETDSPFLVPEPLRSQKAFPNEPKNIRLITEYISKLLKIPFRELVEITTSSSKRLFRIEH